MTFNPLSVRLGRNKSDPTAPRIRLADYLNVPGLPPPPTSVNWTATVPTPCGMMGNDTVGDCTIAGAGHMIQIWTGNAQPPGTVIADSDILAEYEALSGYKPGSPQTDTGLDPITVLNHWQSDGIAGHKIAGWAQVNPKNLIEVQTAINLFGGLYAAVALPITAQNQVGWTWDVVLNSGTDQAPGSWGGHLAPIIGYNGTGPGCVTWGKWWQQMTWAFEFAYYDELFAVVTQDFLNANGTDPQGLNLQQLMADQLLLAA